MTQPIVLRSADYGRVAILGTVGGALLTVVALHPGWAAVLNLAQSLSQSPLSSDASFGDARRWIEVNLSASVLPFAALAFLYLATLRTARIRLRSASNPLQALVPSLGMLQLWSSTFFGIGVLWTAIGMRSAMLHSLGHLGPDGPGGLNAFQLMTRLVDGGVLTALTTTIVGATGNFLMNILTQLTVTLPAQQLAVRQQADEARRVLDTLRMIALNTAVSPSLVPEPSARREGDPC